MSHFAFVRFSSLTVSIIRTYNVQIQVGETHIPVVLGKGSPMSPIASGMLIWWQDTGSSDLWVLSTSCRETCPSNKVPLYPLSSFRPAHLDAQLAYGDSNTGTYAKGPIGSDFVSLAGLGLQDQFFSAINSTNTSVIQTGSAGIFGLGFPFNRCVDRFSKAILPGIDRGI